MNLIDIILTIPLAYGLIKGFYKGLINELFSLIALLAGMGIAYTYYPDFTENIKKNFLLNLSETQLNVISFASIFIIVAVIIFLIGKVISKFLSALALGFFNRLLGGLFGFTKMLLILMIMVILVIPIMEKQSFYEGNMLEKSFIYQNLALLGSSFF